MVNFLLPVPLTRYKSLAYQKLAGLPLKDMHRRTHKLLLILLTLALAVAPLRGAWAVPDTSPATATDSSTHCEQMQHGKASDTGMHAGHDTAIESSGPCSQDCSGSCCDGACSACVHATPAIPGTITVLSGTTASTLNTTFSQVFPERPAIPLLHPPA